MRVKELFRKVEALLGQSSIPDSYRTAVWIFRDVLQCESSHLISHAENQVDRKDATRILSMAERCATHEPVQYVTGSTEFRGLQLQLSPQVLIPRPETEQLVEIALEAGRQEVPLRILDIGTGSGCIALAVKHALPDASVTACDISRSALRVAKTNAVKNGLEVQLIVADLSSKSFVSLVGGGYNLVIANPPYIPNREYLGLPRMIRDYEPETALLCGDDPLKFYRLIASHLALGLLEQRGTLALEVHADYAESVGELFWQHRGLNIQKKHDLAGHPRFVIVKSV